MAQEIKQANIWGRLGTGIGKGLSESLPQEIDRARLASGLSQFEKDSGNLNPIQQVARLSAIPGITPQMIQSLSELSKTQNQRNIYGPGRKERQERELTASPQPSPEQLKEQRQAINFLNLPNTNRQKSEAEPLKSVAEKEEKIPSNYPSAESESKAVQGIPIANELSRNLEPIPPWTQDRHLDEMGQFLERDPNLSLQQAAQMSRDKEARERAQPESEREVQEFRKGARAELDKEFDSQIATILQKEGNDIYSDLTGDTLLNLKKRAYNDLATDPGTNARKVAEKWIRKGKNLAEEKSVIKALAYRDRWDKISPSKKNEALKRLKSAQSIYEETGNNNEFYDMLTSNNSPSQTHTDGKGNTIVDVPERFGFGLSPGRAASIAYPRSPQVKNIIQENKNWHKRGGGREKEFGKAPQENRRFAEEIGKELRSSDSLLAIANQMKLDNPLFNDVDFIDYFRENQNELGLTPRMKKELTIGVSDIFSNWGDLALFPLSGKAVVND